MSPPPRPRPVSMVLLEEGVPKSALLAYVSRSSAPVAPATPSEMGTIQRIGTVRWTIEAALKAEAAVKSCAHDRNLNVHRRIGPRFE